MLLTSIAFACYVVFASNIVLAQDSSSKEYKLKAAFIYKFIDFVTWPSDATDSETFNICTTGTDMFGDALEPLKAKKTKNKTIAIKRKVKEQDFAQCNILFVGSSSESYMQTVLQKTGGGPILTIGENYNFAESGGVIGFYEHESKIRFKINTNAAAQAKLNISSDLLKLAKIVGG